VKLMLTTYRTRKEWYIEGSKINLLEVRPTESYVLLTNGLKVLDETLDAYDKKYNLAGIFYKHVTVKGRPYQYFYRYVKKDGIEKQEYIGSKKKTPPELWENPILVMIERQEIIIKEPHIVVKDDAFDKLYELNEKFSKLSFLHIHGKRVI